MLFSAEIVGEHLVQVKGHQRPKEQMPDHEAQRGLNVVILDYQVHIGPAGRHVVPLQKQNRLKEQVPDSFNKDFINSFPLLYGKFIIINLNKFIPTFIR